MQLLDLLVSRLELLQAGFEAMGPSQVGRVLPAALVSGVLASSGVLLAELRVGSEARGLWLAGQLAWVWPLPEGAVVEAGGPAVVVLVVGQLSAASAGLVAAPGSLNLLPDRHWHNRQSSRVHCLCNQHLPVQRSNSLRFFPDTVLWATNQVVMLDTLPEPELELEPEVELEVELEIETQLQQGLE